MIYAFQKIIRMLTAMAYLLWRVQFCDIAVLQAANRRQLMINWIILSSSNFYKDKDTSNRTLQFLKKKNKIKYFEHTENSVII